MSSTSCNDSARQSAVAAPKKQAIENLYDRIKTQA